MVEKQRFALHLALRQRKGIKKELSEKTSAMICKLFCECKEKGKINQTALVYF